MYAIRSYYAVIGPILRRGGAFFLRRSFKGNAMYSVIFNEYLAQLIDRGVPIEYFIEGGRSRVITSYSIHYTKLYEVREMRPRLELRWRVAAHCRTSFGMDGKSCIWTEPTSPSCASCGRTRGYPTT